jgi:hypothetical protein
MPCARRSRFALSAVVAVTALSLPASAAAAESGDGDCAPGSTYKTFMPWLDAANYIPAPGGDAETAGAWDLRGGAAVVAGNEPFRVGAPDDQASLRLPSGSSAATAPMCIGIEHPTVRFFAKRETGSLLDTLRVDALFTDAAGHDNVLPIGTVLGFGNWAPTTPLAIGVNALALIGDPLQVSFRFVPLNGSRWSVDDVYIDPYRTN